LKKGYTLIELMVVMAIAGLLLALGIPTFGRMNAQVNFKEKADEVSTLINQAYLLSKNPESVQVAQYEIVVSPDDTTLTLQECNTIDSTALDIVKPCKAPITTVRTVTLLAGEIFSQSPDPAYLRCSTDLEIGCGVDGNADSFFFTDNKLSPSETASFVIKPTPFKISITTAGVH